MANITEQATNNSRSRSAARVKRHSARTDMTPMVDLGFLLIAFFVMTTEMSKPAVTKLVMPKETTDGHVNKICNSTALTLLIGGEKLYYYVGDWEQAQDAGEVYETSFSVKDGIGKVIRERQAWLGKEKISGEGRDGLVFLIKPGKEANYQQVIDAMDETQINGVKRYVIVSPGEEESALLARK
ncbi:biopolymer transporter ExbD [Terrimonas sp. NA20]|uniref:Biopolymer transporter ExbD n=1 Tax=Terrimonas ginsenosidimutans TaxID=2908004 RepID=A0ABS9KKZ4_9BACT|nr:biopolymer transporter ExbD [Terrimonas ginsenosidimutans]MCG2612979.1 biopolymer transporter ExbD [Terrimonas ginsenosidimutans]